MARDIVLAITSPSTGIPSQFTIGGGFNNCSNTACTIRDGVLFASQPVSNPASQSHCTVSFLGPITAPTILGWILRKQTLRWDRSKYFAHHHITNSTISDSFFCVSTSSLLGSDLNQLKQQLTFVLLFPMCQALTSIQICKVTLNPHLILVLYPFYWLKVKAKRSQTI